MKKLLISIFLLAAVIIFSGCTENARAKRYGGTMTIALEPNQKLIDVTWKESSIWYMTKPMGSTDVAETYTFREESGFGYIEGKVVFIESK